MNNKKVRTMIASVSPYVSYAIELLARANEIEVTKVNSDESKVDYLKHGWTELSFAESVIITKVNKTANPFGFYSALLARKRTLPNKPKGFNEDDFVSANVSLLRKEGAIDKLFDDLGSICNEAYARFMESPIPIMFPQNDEFEGDVLNFNPAPLGLMK